MSKRSRSLRASLAIQLAVPSFMLLACAGDPPGGDSSTGERIEATRLDGTVLVEELRIGSLNDGPYALSSVWSLEVDAEGRIYAGLNSVGEVRLYDREGEYVRTIGRRGEGPGEFMLARQLMLSPEGLLWVVDPRLARYSVFDSAGALVGVHRRRTSGHNCPIWTPGWISDSGRIFDGPPTTTDGGLVLARSGMPILGQVTSSCGIGPLDDSLEVGEPVRVRIEAQPLGPYGTRAPFAFDRKDETLWVGFNNEYRIFKLSASGDTLAIATRDVQPVPVKPDDVDRMLEARRRAFAGVPGGGGAAPRDVPTTKPYFSHLVVDDTGRLWVATVGEVDGVATQFDVFDRSGEFLGTVRSEVPLRVASTGGVQSDRYPLLSRGKYLYGVHEDDLGVPHIVRLELPQP